MLSTKCILLPSDPSDGARVSVMSRHTLPDGTTPDPRIDVSSLALWWRELAPPPKVVGAWYRGEIDWARFESLYADHLVSVDDNVALLATLASSMDVTLLCVEEDCGRCHRRLLAERVRALFPDVEVRLDMPP